MVILTTALIVTAVLVFLLRVRPAPLVDDIRLPAPLLELEARRRQIYASLRDLQFEYRLGKLSEQDYQKAREDLQRELSRTNQQLQALRAQLALEQPRQPQAAGSKRKSDLLTKAAPHGDRRAYGASTAAACTCPHCGAEFAQPMKYCGQCGKPMTGVVA